MTKRLDRSQYDLEFPPLTGDELLDEVLGDLAIMTSEPERRCAEARAFAHVAALLSIKYERTGVSVTDAEALGIALMLFGAGPGYIEELKRSIRRSVAGPSPPAAVTPPRLSVVGGADSTTTTGDQDQT